MGKNDCSPSICSTPLNCSSNQCSKDQIVCFNNCYRFFINFPTTGPVGIFNRQSLTTTPFDNVTVCIENEGPDSILFNFVFSGVGVLPNDIVIPPNSGTVFVASNVFAARIITSATGTASGQVRIEGQEIIKVNC